MANKWWEIAIVFLALLALAIVSTYPLILYFDTGIPYAPFGGEKVWNRTGDQIQLMYWFWLVKENFLGHVPFNSNPFEFNMIVANENTGLNTIPLAFLYMLFSPLGDIAAYNSSIISSYLLAGVFMYLLVRLYSGSRMGGLLAVVIFTFAPSRIRGFTAGHGYGFLYFCYPFILYFLEKGIRSKKIRYGLLSAFGLIGLAMLEPHLIYYICTFLGLYIPVRLIALLAGNSEVQSNIRQKVVSNLISWPVIWGAGAAVTVYSQCFFSIKYSTPFLTPVFWWVVALYPLLFVLISLCLSALYQRISSLTYQESLWLEAKSVLPLYLFLLLSVLLKVRSPINSDLIVFASFAGVLVLKIWFLRTHLYPMVKTLLQGIWERRQAVFPVLPLVLAMAGIVKWMSSSKVDQIAETIAGSGRTLGDVGLFSAKIADLFSSTSNVYIGIVPALLCGGFLLWLVLTSWFGKKRLRFSGEAELLTLFYMVIAFCCLILALGLAFGQVSLYALFFHYFPFFHYPRVSDRIITLALFALAIVVGYVVKSIFQGYRGKVGRRVVTLLLFAAMALQLKQYNILKPMGINILDRGQDIYSYVKKNIGDGRLLEIPLWPGDSHQSSLYQHYIMLDRIPRINGNSPMVLKEYLDTVYSPLSSIDQGRLDLQQFELLHELGVKYLTVHNNRDVFPEKVSPFVPLTTVRRLANSPYLELLDIDNYMHFKTWSGKNVRLFLFRVRDKASVQADSEQAWYDMPYFYGVNSRLHKQVGEITLDEDLGHDVFQAIEGRDQPGFLVYGPYDVFPPGYQSTFSISTEGEKGVELARLEISAVYAVGEVTLLSQKVIRGTGEESGYINYTLPHLIDKDTQLEFRVYYYGKGKVCLDKIKVNMMQESKILTVMEAEKMVGNTGRIVSVEGASGGKVLEAEVERDSPDLLVYGPNRTYPKGVYVARFFLRRVGPLDVGNQNSVVAEIAVTDWQGSKVYTKRNIKAAQLTESLAAFVEVELKLLRDDELNFRVTFLGNQTLQVDKIEIVPQ